MTDEKSFLSRWSQRKTTGKEQSSAETMTVASRTSDSSSDLPTEIPPADPGLSGENPEAEELPDIETLGKDSDYTGFMKEGVPEGLQKLALRKLWQSDPAFAFRDGLDDYDEDFSFVGDLTEKLKTAYRAGSGYETEEPEVAAEAEGDAAAESAAEPEETDEKEASVAESEQSGTGSEAESPQFVRGEVPDRGKA